MAVEKVGLVTLLVPGLVLEQDHVDEDHQKGRGAGRIGARQRHPLFEDEEDEVAEERANEEKLRHDDGEDVQVRPKEPAKR